MTWERSEIVEAKYNEYWAEARQADMYTCEACHRCGRLVTLNLMHDWGCDFCEDEEDVN
jgi:hypothetical protein